MGAIDKATTRYMRMNEVFADAYNFLMYNGREVIKPGSLEELDTKEIVIPYGDGIKVAKPLQKTRDVVKMVTAMTDKKAAYLILGIENQTNVHYAMPVRNLVYDALQYEKQISDAASYRRGFDTDNEKDAAAYLSGFGRKDRLMPVITIVIHFSPETWDGPRSIHEMYGEQDDEVLSFAQDYTLHLIEPAKIKETDFKKFRSSLREVLHLIKVSNDANKIQELVYSDERFEHLGRAEMDVLNACMHLGLKMKKGDNTVSMTSGVEALKERSREEGREEGRIKGREEATTNSIISLMKTMGLSLEQTMEALQIPESEQEKYRSML